MICFDYLLGIIHGDLKPANILLDQNYKLMLAEFGFSRRNTDAGFVQTSRNMGTLGFVAPEYMLSGRLTVFIDMFAYGVNLYELLSGTNVDRQSMIHGVVRTLLILSFNLI
ncbi:putative protein kinase TKL-Cr-3 family [Helianthus anomalus]